MRVRTLLLVASTLVGLEGCVSLDELHCVPVCAAHTHSSSSLVGFLYPNGGSPPVQNSIPQLRIPLRVGLAFLPTPGPNATNGLTESEKEQVLERVRQRFMSRRFVSEITVIPDYYLAGAKGFGGLEGVQRLYGVDVMALVSFDQVVNSSNLKYRSLAYLTIVGAFVVNGSEHEVTTLMDLAVVDPGARSLILRAGGTDVQRGVSSLVRQVNDVRGASAGGFSAASDVMIEHFDLALSQFELNVRSGTAHVAVVNRDGSPRGGGGAFSAFSVLLVLMPLAMRRWQAWLWRRRRVPSIRGA